MKEKTFYLLLPCIVVFAYYLFLQGFFPLKKVIPGSAKLEKFTLVNTTIAQPSKRFDKVILILIDALRSDFVTDRNSMPFVQELQKAGLSRSFVVRAHPPTVTLPRLKALTSGSIPGFVDVVMNFDSQSLTEDNIISQAFNDGRKIVFYGDDTWIKLFPEHFVRSEGTTSFFVTDYIEVDKNVTRHISRELSTLDWDMMILHYLGLDHIGHTAGAYSALVEPKLMEMDKVIQSIYTALKDKNENSVILVCGDHGMLDQGSHGGASDNEMLVPAVFLSHTFEQPGSPWHSHRYPLQIDLAPTLAVLTGLPIPNNNLGQVMIRALDGFTEEEKLDVLYVNCQQILRLMDENVPGYISESSYELYVRAVRLHEEYINASSSFKPDVEKIIHSYEEALDTMATRISASLTTYDLYSMTVGIGILCLCLLVCVSHVIYTMAGSAITVYWLSTSASVLLFLCFFGHVTACTSQSYYSPLLCRWDITSVIVQLTVCACVQFLCVVLVDSLQKVYTCLKLPKWNSLHVLLVIGTLLHSVSFASSSFVEEEHQTWYFLVMTFNIAVMVTQITHNIKKSFFKKDDDTSINGLYNLPPSSKGNITVDDDNDDDNDDNAKHENKDYQERKLESQIKCTLRNKTIFCETPRGNYKSLNNSASSKLHHLLPVSVFELPWRKLLPWRLIVGATTVLLLGRCLRTINQTGNKWLDTPDVGDWLSRDENKFVLSLLVPASLLCILLTRANWVTMETFLLALGLIGCYGYKIKTGSVLKLIGEGYVESHGVTEARFVYLIIFLMNLVSVIRWFHNKYASSSVSSAAHRTKLCINTMETIQSSWIVLMTLLLRSHNTVFVAMVVVQEQLIWRYVISVTSLPVKYLTLLCWWMGQAVFFQQGNSNSLSTVDVAAGYVGLEDYQVIFVVPLLYSSTYAGPIFWLMSLVKNITVLSHKHTDTPTRLRDSFISCVEVLSLERVLTICLYCIVVTTQRYHLFVWTVFSPKLLFEAYFTVLYAVFSIVLLVMT